MDNCLFHEYIQSNVSEYVCLRNKDMKIGAESMNVRHIGVKKQQVCKKTWGVFIARDVSAVPSCKIASGFPLVVVKCMCMCKCDIRL